MNLLYEYCDNLEFWKIASGNPGFNEVVEFAADIDSRALRTWKEKKCQVCVDPEVGAAWLPTQFLLKCLG